MMKRIQRTPARRAPGRSANPSPFRAPILRGAVALAVAAGSFALLPGCDSGARGSGVDFSRTPERRVKSAPRRAPPPVASPDAQLVQLAPGTAREVSSGVERSADRSGETLSLGAPREGPPRRSSSEEALSVLERYLKRTERATREKPVDSVQSFRRKASESSPRSVDSSRADVRSVDAETGESIDWQPLFRGIERVRVRASRPRRMEGQALRIDTQAEGIEFITTPKSHRGGDTLGLKTTSFLRTFKCQAAINAAFFGPMQGSEGRPVDVYGLQISRGEIVSNDGRNQPSLLIRRDNRARIASPPFDLDEVYNAVTGDRVVLEDGEVVGSRGDVHPRVCAGVSRDGRYVFLLTVDGRQGGWSDGATKYDLGSWLKRLGAWDGLNLDGGGTAVMVVEENGRPTIISRPIHDGWPGNERVSGSHLGVIAKALASE